MCSCFQYSGYNFVCHATYLGLYKIMKGHHEYGFKSDYTVTCLKPTPANRLNVLPSELMNTLTNTIEQFNRVRSSELSIFQLHFMKYHTSLTTSGGGVVAEPCKKKSVDSSINHFLSVV